MYVSVMLMSHMLPFVVWRIVRFPFVQNLNALMRMLCTCLLHQLWFEFGRLKYSSEVSVNDTILDPERYTMFDVSSWSKFKMR